MSLPRVLHVMAGAEHGGAETYFLDLLQALAAAGLPQQAVIRPTPDRVGILDAAGIPWHPAAFRTWWPFSTRSAIRRAVAAFRPQVVQAWMGRAGSMTPPTGVPSIGWFGGYYQPRRFAACEHFVGVSRDIVRHQVALGVPAEKAHLIHTFPNIGDEPAVPRAEFATPEEAPLILALARLHPKKGLDTLLKALALLPGAYLWIAGEGPSRGELEALTRELGLEERVRFLGWRQDRGGLLRAADVCAFPSRYEPFGTVTIEAWATATPLVAAKAAGPAAYIEDGVSGLLVEIDAVEALAAALKRVIEDRGLAARLVEGGTAAYEAEFTRERIVSDYLDLYRRLAAPSAG